MMQPDETYDEWHRREFPNQYVWQNHTYPDFGTSDGQLVTKIPLHIFGCQNCMLTIDGTSLTKSHKRTIEYVIKEQNLLVDDIREHVFRYYQFLWDDFLNHGSNFPNPSDIDSKVVERFIRLKSIYLAERIDEGYFGLCFSCDFEMEHGLGIRLRNYKVEEVGGEDVGFSVYPDK